MPENSVMSFFLASRIARRGGVIHRRMRLGGGTRICAASPRRCAACRNRNRRSAPSALRQPASPRGSFPTRCSRRSASTWSRCTRLRNSVTTCAVEPASSTYFGSILVPPRPTVLYGAGALPALSASMTISAPLRLGTPNGLAAGPLRNVTMPSLIGAACGRSLLRRRDTGRRQRHCRRRKRCPK